MFHFYPNTRQEWLQILLFPFRAYTLLAFVTIHYLGAEWPRNHSMTCFMWIYLGYGFSCAVLFIVGIIQLFAANRRMGYVNVGMALLASLLGLSFPNLVVA